MRKYKILLTIKTISQITLGLYHIDLFDAVRNQRNSPLIILSLINI